MKATTISYSKTFPRAQYGINDRIGIEVEREDGDTPEECFDYAYKLVEEFNNKAVANQPPEQVTDNNEYRGVHEKIITPEAVTDRIGQIERDIMSCREVKILETYRLIKRTDPKLETAYDLKMKELTGL